MTASIKTKIVVFYMGVLFAALSAFALLLYFSLVKIMFDAIDSGLLSRSRALATLVRDNEDETEFNFSDDVMWEYQSRKSRNFFQIRLSDGTLLEKSESVGKSELPYSPQTQPVVFRSIQFRGNPTRMVDFRLPAVKNGSASKQPHIIQCAEDISQSLAMLHTYRVILSVTVLGIMVFSSSGGFLIARKGLKPVKDISRAIRNISESNLSERIVVNNTPEELRELAAAFNHTFDSLEKSFNRQKQFVSDVSHELRTPLAVILSQSEITLRKERPAAEYRTALAGIFDVSQLMSRTVQKLLTLVRLGADSVELRFENMDVAVIVSDTIRLLEPIAVQAEVAIEFIDDGPHVISGDRAALLEVFMNIIDNAVKYNSYPGKIGISFHNEHGWVITDITDTGIGIPEKDLERVWDRFYRVDKSRSKEIDGVGLGLSICDEIIKLHGGRISIKSTVNTGTMVSVFLKEAAPGDRT